MAGSPQPSIAIAPVSESVATTHDRRSAPEAAATLPGQPSPAGPLSHIPLFSTLEAGEQRLLMGSMRVEHLTAHQTIFWRGDRGDSLFLISKGKVSVTVPSDDGEHVVLDYLGAGGFFGEISL